MSAVLGPDEEFDSPPTRIEATASSGIMPETPLTIREAVLDEPTTGAVYTVSQTTQADRRLVRKDSPGQSFSVIAERAAPTYYPSGTSEPFESRPRRATGGIHLYRTNDVPSKRRERRLQEHRERVAQVRARLGDPNEALDRFMVEAFDADALRRVAHEFASETLGYPYPDEEGDDSRDGNER